MISKGVSKMKYCPNCGNQLNENEAFCPKCGTKMGDKSEANQQQKPTSGPKPRVENRNTVMNIILTIVTCGIYGIIWFINMVNDVNTVTQDEQSNQSGGTVFLLSLITCGIYGIICICSHLRGRTIQHSAYIFHGFAQSKHR